MSRGNFRSDNESGVAPEIMDALVRVNAGSAHAYGDDALTARVSARFREIFETDQLEVFPLTTGTGANALAVAQLAPPYGAVYCHSHSHLNTDECGAPEFYSGGAKLIGLAGATAKLDAPALDQAIAAGFELGVHSSMPSAVSVSQATEFGAVYTPAELAPITEVARRHRVALHMDGARFANAIAHLGCAPADVTWRAGVDVLSFGASKNGAMAAEALLVFRPALAAGLDRRRKRAGHLLSKMRYVSAQLEAYLEDGLWLRLAAHANAAASRLAAGFGDVEGARLAHEPQANEVFVHLEQALVDHLRAAGFEFHPWPGTTDLYRFVAAFDTDPATVDDLIATARQR